MGFNNQIRITRRAMQAGRSPLVGYRKYGVGVSLARAFVTTMCGVAGLVATNPTDALALPFNQDMVGSQISNGAIMRKHAEGAVATSDAERYVGLTREGALTLTNPIPATPESLSKGARLFSANCSPCHGRYNEGKYIPGAVSNYVPGPNLALSFYKEKPDAHFFQFIHFGGMAIMPAYGWKFSMEEHWDIVNYVRQVQNEMTPTDPQSSK